METPASASIQIRLTATMDDVEKLAFHACL